MNKEQKELAEFIAARFDAGCLLGDMSRDALQNDDMDEEDEIAMTCAREGWLAAGGN